ncbi:MAG: pantetheine-phosphate adenylyltransferase [Symbiobacteriaceae bacterium]|nr:pantetheine-phosphate adenylyltransferase [Symbiobacteriaceae bacterium]
MEAIIAMYPGTYDPVTYGHLDIIERAARLFKEVHVTIVTNPAKKTLFTTEERLEMLEKATVHIPNIRVSHFDGLSVDYCRMVGAKAIVRGLRAQMDFEFEFQIAAANQYLNPEIEMCFLMTRQNLAFVSSSVVKEIALFQGKLEGLVPDFVQHALRKKYNSD